MNRSENGGALPAALVLQLILLLVGLQVALAASTLRLAVARTGARLQAVSLAQAAISAAAEERGSRLVGILEQGGRLAVDLTPMSPASADQQVSVMDDQDGDGDGRHDDNGRMLLAATAAVVPYPGTQPSRATLVREVLLGSRLPLPAALVDCAGGLAVCGGEDGCAVPRGRVVAMDAAALAVPESRLPALNQALFILSREVLRAALQRCAGSACLDPDDRLLRAAATQVMRLLDPDAPDASGLEAVQVARLVAGLVALDGDESGPGSFPWWDGTWRAVPDQSILPAAVATLALETGHAPSLAGHPYPQVLRGAAESASAAGLCRSLPVFLEAAQRRAGRSGADHQPASAGTLTVLDGPHQVSQGESLDGQGLLVLKGTLTVAAGGRLVWHGSVVVAGGNLVGQGDMVIQGSLLVMSPTAPGAVDLDTAGLSLVRDREAHRRAWESAGNLLLSAWYGPENS